MLTFQYLCNRISHFYCHVTIVAYLIDIMVMDDRFRIMIRNFSTCTVDIQRIFNSDCNAANTRWKPTRKQKVRVTGRKKCMDLCRIKNSNYFLIHFTHICVDKHFYYMCNFVLTAIFRRLSLYITNSPDNELVQYFPSKVNILGSVLAEQTLFAIFLSWSKRNICRKK